MYNFKNISFFCVFQLKKTKIPPIVAPKPSRPVNLEGSGNLSGSDKESSPPPPSWFTEAKLKAKKTTVQLPGLGVTTTTTTTTTTSSSSSNMAESENKIRQEAEPEKPAWMKDAMEKRKKVQNILEAKGRFCCLSGINHYAGGG